MVEQTPTAGETRSDDNNHVLLRVEHLRAYFRTSEGLARAVDDVSFELRKGQTLGVVGESGCGKSVTSLSILRLLPEPPAEILSGSRIVFEGRDLLALSPAEMRRIRGNKISMIFQEPMTSLNPVFTIGDQIGEVLRVHKGLSRREALDEAIRLLSIVHMPRPEERVRHYPHQLSGGMRQRVMIAMALACNPALLIADEPSTALDVTVQAQILSLMNELRAKFQSSIMLITHDLGVIAEMCDEVIVMYAGQVVEAAPVVELFRRPLHPYTRGLMRCIPRPDDIRTGRRLYSIEGTVPAATNFPEGCRFHPRCPFATAECRRDVPPIIAAAPAHTVRCLWWEKIEAEQPANAIHANGR
ncbi:MAG: ABC transporter ATP-binding protein [Candidatus Sumerlaeia bacterium]